jgi:hypothetical protein
MPTPNLFNLTFSLPLSLPSPSLLFPFFLPPFSLPLFSLLSLLLTFLQDKVLKKEMLVDNYSSLFLTNWILEFFYGVLPFDLMLKVWDLIFLCGHSFVFATGLALLSRLEGMRREGGVEKGRGAGKGGNRKGRGGRRTEVVTLAEDLPERFHLREGRPNEIPVSGRVRRREGEDGERGIRGRRRKEEGGRGGRGGRGERRGRGGRGG